MFLCYFFFVWRPFYFSGGGMVDRWVGWVTDKETVWWRTLAGVQWFSEDAAGLVLATLKVEEVILVAAWQIVRWSMLVCMCLTCNSRQTKNHYFSIIIHCYRQMDIPNVYLYISLVVVS